MDSLTFGRLLVNGDMIFVPRLVVRVVFIRPLAGRIRLRPSLHAAGAGEAPHEREQPLESLAVEAAGRMPLPW
jgi:hypothetical protein